MISHYNGQGPHPMYELTWTFAPDTDPDLKNYIYRKIGKPRSETSTAANWTFETPTTQKGKTIEIIANGWDNRHVCERRDCNRKAVDSVYALGYHASVCQYHKDTLTGPAYQGNDAG